MDHVYQDISFASLFHGQKSEKLSDEAKMGLKETTPPPPAPHTHTHFFCSNFHYYKEGYHYFIKNNFLKVIVV